MSPDKKPSIAAALASSATRECRKAIRSLADTKQRHEGIHEARKAIRRLKSLLVLAEEPFAEPLPGIKATLDQLAVGLSPLRDAYVALNTARSLAGPRPSPEWRHVLEKLEHRSEGRLAAELHKDPNFLKRRRQLRELMATLDGLPWQRIRLRTIAEALERSEARVGRSHKRANKAATPANLHDWRRKARRLRMQLELWRRVRKTTGKAGHRQAPGHKEKTHDMSKLSDALGAKQDLRALRATLRTLREPEAIAPLLEQIRQELKKHRKKS
ncbi:CHAD domain-containing protein [Luteibacter yeojuensis]|uniref:CHAD domain-containing protein n=1 Tax=Luteibacter yeojuensis TaxID=345309 RepID=A0A7X5QSY2_9GAMM|nr:CHAD domain-containing protein [Luteibacter yeojuensis]NID14831.1 CHAD domain-containing protein [Luteibacter yeojuensis]